MYVVVGTRGVVTFAGGFACTRDELTQEIRTRADSVAREAGLGGIGMILRVEEYGSRAAAESVAQCYRDEEAARRLAVLKSLKVKPLDAAPAGVSEESWLAANNRD